MSGFFGIGQSAPPKANIPNYFDSPVDPRFQAMQDRLNTMSGPRQVAFTPETDSYKAKDFSGELPEFEKARNSTSQQLTAQNQAAQDAIQRKFASMGNLNSGAAVKAMQIQEQQAAENKANAMNSIGVQEAQARRGLQQQEAQKEFQSLESQKGRNFQGSTQASVFNAQQGNQFSQWQFDAGSKLASLDLAFKQAQQQAAEEQYNAAMNTYKANNSGGLLGAGGLLGTGLF